MDNNKKLTDNSFQKLMIMSLASIFAGMICLASATWAWYSTSVESNGSVIASALYDVRVVSDPAARMIYDEENQYMLGVGSYEFSIHQTGTSEAGYCVVTVYDADGNTVSKYYAGKFGVGNPLYINVTVAPIEGHDVRAIIKISPIWGYYSSSLQDLPDDGVIYGFSVGEIIPDEIPEVTTPTTDIPVPEETEVLDDTTVADETPAISEETEVSDDTTVADETPAISEETEEESVSEPVEKEITE